MENQASDQPKKVPSFGEKRVNMIHSTDGELIVKSFHVKEKCAELIDLFKEFSDEVAFTTEAKRCFAMAMTDIESGCHFAVKGLFKD